MTTELLRQGIEAAKAGQAAQAHNILKQVIEREPQNEKAWLWLSGVVQTDEQRLICLQNVLAIDPHNKIAQRGLAALRQKAIVIKPLPEGLSQPGSVITEPPAFITSSVSRPETKKSSPWAVVALVALIMLVVGLWCNDRWNAVFRPNSDSSATPTPTRSTIGKQGILHVDRGPSTHPVAIDEDTLKELFRVIDAKDDYGMSELLQTGRLLPVQDGTKILMIDEGLYTTKIRILEGPYAGRSGWVPYEWIIIK